MVETPWTTRYHECRIYHSSYILSYLPGSCFSVSVSISSQPHQKPSKKKKHQLHFPKSFRLISGNGEKRSKRERSWVDCMELVELSNLHDYINDPYPRRCIHIEYLNLHLQAPQPRIPCGGICVSGKRWIGLDFCCWCWVSLNDEGVKNVLVDSYMNVHHLI